MMPASGTLQRVFGCEVEVCSVPEHSTLRYVVMVVIDFDVLSYHTQGQNQRRPVDFQLLCQKA